MLQFQKIPEDALSPSVDSQHCVHFLRKGLCRSRLALGADAVPLTFLMYSQVRQLLEVQQELPLAIVSPPDLWVHKNVTRADTRPSTGLLLQGQGRRSSLL